MILHGHTAHSYVPTNPVATQHQPLTLQEAKQQLPTGDKWAVEQLSCPDERLSLAALVATNEVIAVSDGSHEDGLSTSAFIITTRSKKLELTTPTVMGRNCVPGHPTDQQSHRGGLGGIMGIVVALALLCRIHNITSGSIEIGQDGEEAMKAVFSKWDPKPDQADYDLILDLRRKFAKLPITATGRHVEGHQDDPRKRKPGPIKPLDRWAKLNVAMDARAKKLLRQ